MKSVPDTISEEFHNTDLDSQRIKKRIYTEKEIIIQTQKED